MSDFGLLLLVLLILVSVINHWLNQPVAPSPPRLCRDKRRCGCISGYYCDTRFVHADGMLCPWVDKHTSIDEPCPRLPQFEPGV